MGAVTARATAIAALLDAAGAKATSDVRKVKLPGFLVIPVPSLAFTVLDGSSVEATFKVMALVGGVGDLAAAEQLEELVLKAVEVLDVETVEPGSYVLPTQSDPVPAYEITLSTDVLDVTT